MKDKKVINLSGYKKPQATAFTGRPEGKETRKDLKLTDYDSSDIEVVFQIPENTTSINPSYFLGLFFDSYISLGEKQFLEKYFFEIMTSDFSIKKLIKKDIEDGLGKCRIYSSIDSALDDLD